MKFLPVLFLLIFYGSLKSQKFIDEPYYFVGVDEMHVYKQSNDTLYNFTTFSVKNNPKLDFKRNHYKIWGNQDLGKEFFALKVERLDTIPLTTNPYPDERFNIWIYKRTPKKITFLKQISQLKKSEMQNYTLDTLHNNDKYGQTFYSLTYMNELLKLKRVKTKKDVDIINNELNNPEYLEFAEDYQKNNKMPDMYASGLMAMLINKATIKVGYSPIGASVLMNIINSKMYDEDKKRKIIAEYYEKINPE